MHMSWLREEQRERGAPLYGRHAPWALEQALKRYATAQCLAHRMYGYSVHAPYSVLRTRHGTVWDVACELSPAGRKPGLAVASTHHLLLHAGGVCGSRQSGPARRSAGSLRAEAAPSVQCRGPAAHFSFPWDPLPPLQSLFYRGRGPVHAPASRGLCVLSPNKVRMHITNELHLHMCIGGTYISYRLVRVSLAASSPTPYPRNLCTSIVSIIQQLTFAHPSTSHARVHRRRLSGTCHLCPYIA